MMRAVLALAMLVTSAAMAQQDVPTVPLLPGIGSHDPRQPVLVDEPPWRSLGRVQTELGGRCTGTLIAPDQVLTAAHCLVAARSGNLVQPRSVHFLLGYVHGQFRAHGRVVSYRLGPGYGAGRRGRTADDWAVLTLAQRLPEPGLPLLERTPPPRTALVVAGYQQDRPEVLLADAGCRLLDARDGILLHDCAGTRGASGAPLLVRTANGWAIVGVMSRMAPDVSLGQAASVERLRSVLR